MVEPKISIRDLSYSYRGVEALRNISLDAPRNSITVFLGPAGGGKTTLLRLINRLNDLVEETEMSGHILLDGEDIYAPGTTVPVLRRRIGMVFALPLPLPGTKDRLHDPAIALSGGQQQRLCIARSLALEPEVLLLDEPTSGLDPISTRKVEESLFKLKLDYTIIIVPHSIQQAARVADQAAFFLMGELIEYRAGNEIFTTPRHKKTEDYITGRFG